VHSNSPRCAGLLFLAVPAPSQNVNLKHPEDVAVQKHTTAEEMMGRASNLQLQKDAKELAELCSSVPGDMDAVRQGAINKDVPEKLKRLEKLSKRVRDELMRSATAP
jgi:hypothetical protein